MRIEAVVFPFDSFGSAGTAAGAELLGDLLREILDDTAEESRPVRQQRLAESLTVRDVTLDTMEELAAWRSLGRKAIDRALKADFAVWLGGNHLGVLPVYEALEDTLIVQLDAHLDCYNLHDTKPTLSHGNFLRDVRRRVINVGHRDLFLTPAMIREHFAADYPMERLALDEAGVLAELRQLKNVWLDIDADVFDPSICPAVHSPSPGGLFLPQTLRIIDALGSLRGVSISEFDPGRDLRSQSLDLLGWLLEWLLLRQAK